MNSVVLINDVLRIIFSQLNRESVNRCACVCKAWERVVSKIPRGNLQCTTVVQQFLFLLLFLRCYLALEAELATKIDMKNIKTVSSPK
jgi:hypothetical protein